MDTVNDASSHQNEVRASRSEKFELYLKIIEYKRSIGITQWTVLSIFTTASGAIFALGLKDEPSHGGKRLYAFGIMIYWLGFCLYRRYRSFNREVSRHLVELETQLGLGFQTRLESKFHAMPGLSTKTLLLLAGAVYTCLGLALLIL